MARATREQTEMLKDLSSRIWGSTSRWQKMISHPQFQVADGTKTVVHKNYFTRKSGAVVTATTALNLGLVSRADMGIETESVQTKYRQPNLEELYYMMEKTLDQKRLMTIISLKDQDLRTSPFVFHVVCGTMDYPWNGMQLDQLNTEAYKAELDELVAKLPDAPKEAFMSFLMEPVETIPKGMFDAIDFAKDCLELLDLIETKGQAEVDDSYRYFMAKVDSGLIREDDMEVPGFAAGTTDEKD